MCVADGWLVGWSCAGVCVLSFVSALRFVTNLNVAFVFIVFVCSLHNPAYR